MRKLFALLVLLADSTLILGQISGPMLPGPGMVGGAPAPPFAPADIGGLQVWVKGDAITGLSDGDLLTTWTDLSAGSHDLTWLGAGYTKPTYKVNILAGKAVVRFSGSYTGLMSGAFTLNQPTSVFLVATKNGDSGNRYVADGLAQNTRALMFQYPDATSFSLDAAVAFKQNQTFTDWAVLGGLFQGATSINSYNGTAISGNAGTAAASGVMLGCRGGKGVFFIGDIAEALVYDTALSAPNRQKVEGYLACRWGLQGNLPMGHPYKTACP